MVRLGLQIDVPGRRVADEVELVLELLRLEPLEHADDELVLQPAQGVLELIVEMLLGAPGEVEVEPDRPRPGLVHRIDDVGEIAAVDGQEVGKISNALLGDPDDGDLGMRGGEPLRQPGGAPVGGPVLGAEQGRLDGREEEDGEQREHPAHAGREVVPGALPPLGSRLDGCAHAQGSFYPYRRVSRLAAPFGADCGAPRERSGSALGALWARCETRRWRLSGPSR